MDYTIERIYALVGKDDKTAGLTFKHDSDAYQVFGQFITVVFLYTQKEREELDKLIQNKPWNGHSYLKAKFLGLDLGKDKVSLLKEKGIHSKDIQDILYFTTPAKNAFHSRDKREIKNIELVLKSLPRGGDFDWMYGFYKKQVNEDIGLSPEERASYLAGRIYFEFEEITNEEKREIYQEDGALDVKVEWELLQIKSFREETSEEEETRLAVLYGIKKKESIHILDEYLQDAGSSLKKLAKENIDQVVELFLKVMHFNERRLTVMSKHPIFIDLNSYLHIYMRHVEEFQVTNHFEDKDNFQWDENDVFPVIGNVMEKFEKEYEEFRENNPGKRYSRYGDYSMYYEGDYYTFHIEADGRVSTFHKNRKEHEKK